MNLPAKLGTANVPKNHNKCPISVVAISPISKPSCKKVIIPDNGAKHVVDHPYEVCGVNQEEFLEVLFVRPVQGFVRVPQPSIGRLVFAGQSVVKVDQAVVKLDVLVEGFRQVTKKLVVVKRLEKRN